MKGRLSADRLAPDARAQWMHFAWVIDAFVYPLVKTRSDREPRWPSAAICVTCLLIGLSWRMPSIGAPIRHSPEAYNSRHGKCLSRRIDGHGLADTRGLAGSFPSLERTSGMALMLYECIFVDLEPRGDIL